MLLWNISRSEGKNVENNVTTALQAKKFMNGYIDPDSKKRIGITIKSKHQSMATCGIFES